MDNTPVSRGYLLNIAVVNSERNKCRKRARIENGGGSGVEMGGGAVRRTRVYSEPGALFLEPRFWVSSFRPARLKLTEKDGLPERWWSAKVTLQH